MVEEVPEQLGFAGLGRAHDEDVARLHVLVSGLDGLHLLLAIFVEPDASFSCDVLPHLKQFISITILNH